SRRVWTTWRRWVRCSPCGTTNGRSPTSSRCCLPTRVSAIAGTSSARTARAGRRRPTSRNGFMTSRSGQADGPLRRHDLVFVLPAAWRTTLESYAALAREPLVAGWADCGWPLIARRPAPDDKLGVPVGLPLPPSHGKRRLAFVLQHNDIASTAPPPL